MIKLWFFSHIFLRGLKKEEECIWISLLWVVFAHQAQIVCRLNDWNNSRIDPKNWLLLFYLILENWKTVVPGTGFEPATSGCRRLPLANSRFLIWFWFPTRLWVWRPSQARLPRQLTTDFFSRVFLVCFPSFKLLKVKINIFCYNKFIGLKNQL